MSSLITDIISTLAEITNLGGRQPGGDSCMVNKNPKKIIKIKAAHSLSDHVLAAASVLYRLLASSNLENRRAKPIISVVSASEAAETKPCLSKDE
jgi:hypothetical protein